MKLKYTLQFLSNSGEYFEFSSWKYGTNTNNYQWVIEHKLFRTTGVRISFSDNDYNITPTAIGQHVRKTSRGIAILTIEEIKWKKFK